MSHLSQGTLACCIDGAVRVLVEAGRPVEDSRRDAALLARWHLRWSLADWLTHQHDGVPPDFTRQLDTLVGRRAGGEPIAYITGEREFYGRTFRVTPDVLVPRPETELVVEEAIAVLAARAPAVAGTAPVIVDVGTGSGCLAVTLALEWPAARIVATDVSEAALVVARRNANLLGAGERIVWRLGPMVAATAEPVDLIVANPPYVPEGQRRSLPVEVREFEPRQALFGGLDGLDVIRALLPAAEATLGSDGWLVMEIGIDQDQAVTGLVAATESLVLSHIRPDLQGIPRVVVARKERSHVSVLPHRRG